MPPTSCKCLANGSISQPSTTKSMVKLRLTSLIVPETTAKESRIKLTLSGFALNVLPDLTWIAHLTQFFKAPPHVRFMSSILCQTFTDDL
jgi:autophagy-related protein 2